MPSNAAVDAGHLFPGANNHHTSDAIRASSDEPSSRHMSIYVQGILTLTWREKRPSISVHCNDNKAANTAIASVSSALIIITMSIPSPIFVQSEWARLATVVVSQCEIAFPSLDSGMQGHMDILPSDPDLDWSAASSFPTVPPPLSPSATPLPSCSSRTVSSDPGS